MDESSEQTKYLLIFNEFIIDHILLSEGNHFVEPLNSQEAIEKIMLKQTFLQAN